MSSLTQDERKQYMDTLKLFMIEDWGSGEYTLMLGAQCIFSCTK